MVLVALIPSVTSIVSNMMTRHEARKALSVATETQKKVEQTYHEMNSMKDALVAAEKEASERKGTAAGIDTGIAIEKARAEEAKEK